MKKYKLLQQDDHFEFGDQFYSAGDDKWVYIDMKSINLHLDTKYKAGWLPVRRLLNNKGVE